MNTKTALAGQPSFFGSLAGKLFGLALAVGIGGASLVMVYQYGASRAGDNQIANYVTGVIGAVAVLYSMGALVYSHRFKATKQHGMRAIFIIGLIASEAYIIPYELGWWSQNIMVAEAKQRVSEIGAENSLTAITKAQEIIRQFGSGRSEDQVNASITTALAKQIEVKRGFSKSLADLTANCTNVRSPFYASDCGDVLRFREELATVRKVERARFEAGTTQTGDLVVKPVNAGAEMLSRMTGYKAEPIEYVTLALGLFFLCFGRLGILPAILPGHRTVAHIPTTGQGVIAAVSMGAPLAANDKDEEPIAETPALPKPEEPKPVEASLSGESFLKEVGEEIKKASKTAPFGDVGEFYRTATKEATYAELNAGSFYTAYKGWCLERGLRHFNFNDFGKESKRHIERSKTRKDGRVMYRGRQLMPRLVPASGVLGGAASRVAA